MGSLKCGRSRHSRWALAPLVLSWTMSELDRRQPGLEVCKKGKWVGSNAVVRATSALQLLDFGFQRRKKAIICGGVVNAALLHDQKEICPLRSLHLAQSQQQGPLSLCSGGAVGAVAQGWLHHSCQISVRR